MPEKIIKQQPVTMNQVTRVIFVLMATGGGVDGNTEYKPVDETGKAIGEVRTYVEHFTGPNAARVRDWLTTELLPDVNTFEGT